MAQAACLVLYRGYEENKCFLVWSHSGGEVLVLKPTKNPWRLLVWGWFAFVCLFCFVLLQKQYFNFGGNLF